jgi:hypothetical protein
VTWRTRGRRRRRRRRRRRKKKTYSKQYKTPKSEQVVFIVFQRPAGCTHTQ